jgi:DNA-binding MarR family transcriptional regulator
MRIGAPTLSAALRRLETLGYVTRTPARGDRRGVDLRLTPKGAEALTGTSVLEPARVLGLLRTLAPAERVRAVAGLTVLGRAAAMLGRRGPS